MRRSAGGADGDRSDVAGRRSGAVGAGRAQYPFATRAAAAPRFRSISSGAGTWSSRCWRSQSAINQKIASLPAGTSFEVRRMDPTVFPVLGYSLTSDYAFVSRTPRHRALPVASGAHGHAGVANIGVIGGATAEYQVIVDPAKLAAFGLSLDDVAKALSAANIVIAVGRFRRPRQAVSRRFRHGVPWPSADRPDGAPLWR